MNWKVGNSLALLSIKLRRVVILVITALGILAACVSSATPAATPDNALISPTQSTLSSTIVPTNPVLQCSLSLEELLKEPVLDYATHRTDNDISFSDEPIGLQVLLPQVVIERIHKVAREHFRQYGLEYACTRLADVYGSVIYEVDTPQHQQLFILKLTKPPGVFTYRPILFDPVQNQVTVTPPIL
jgi:hypothetical protein